MVFAAYFFFARDFFLVAVDLAFDTPFFTAALTRDLGTAFFAGAFLTAAFLACVFFFTTALLGPAFLVAALAGADLRAAFLDADVFFFIAIHSLLQSCLRVAPRQLSASLSQGVEARSHFRLFHDRACHPITLFGSGHPENPHSPPPTSDALIQTYEIASLSA